MATIGTLDQDRYEIEYTDGATFVLKGLPLSERDRFLMWYGRFKLLWAACKSLYPGGTLQSFYDPEYIDAETHKLTPNPLYNRHLAWAVDLLLEARGIDLDRIDLDVAYGLLVSYRGEPSVFDQLLVNYPRTADGKPLPPNRDAATDFMGQMLAIGASAADIEWCLDKVPCRELQQAMQVAAEAAKESPSKPDTKPTQDKARDDNRNERLTNCYEAFVKEWGADVRKLDDVEKSVTKGAS